MSARKIPIFSTIVAVAAAAVMVMLGFWQLGRADEKEALIAQFADSSDFLPVELANLREAESLLYRRVVIDCSRAGDWEAVAGRNRQGQTGYLHRYTCLQAPINAGESGGNLRLEVLGVIGWSRGPTQPEWAGGPLEGILAPLGENFKLVSTTPHAGLEAAAIPDPKDMPNNHLAYAGQWFFFAITALVIYWLAIRRRWRDEAKAS